MNVKDIVIRFAKLEDLNAIVDIYNQAIKSGNATGDIEEFKVNDRNNWFNKFDNNSYPIYVAELNNILVGFCTLSPYRPGRKAMLQVAEISYYLDYNYHRLGIGSKLLNFVISDCKRIGKESLLAILLDINLPSIKLLEKLHFKRWGYFPNIIKFEKIRCSHLVYGLNLRKLNEII